MSWTAWEFDPEYYSASPSTYTGDDIEPHVPADFGRRCPQPGPTFEVTRTTPNSVTISADVDSALAGLTTGRHDIDGPVLGGDVYDWSYRLRVFVGETQIGADHVWPILQGPSGATPSPAQVIDGITDDVEHRFELAVVNDYETSQSTTVVHGATPGQIDVGRLHPVDPFRAIDTRVGLGGLRLRAGESRVLALPGSVGSRAVTVNATAVNPDGAGFLTFHPCDQPRPQTSNVNYEAASIATANQVTVALGASGALCVFSLLGADLVIDVAGWWRLGDGLGLSASSPTRVVDTRPLLVGAGETLAIDLTDDVSADAHAVSFSITTTDVAAHGYVALHPCDQPRPVVSNVNTVPGRIIANLVTVPLGEERRVCAYSLTATALVVDLVGVWTPTAAGDRLAAQLQPRRLVDTRVDPTQRLEAMRPRRVIDQHPGHVMLNVTADRSVGDGYLAAFPCDDGHRSTSNVNYRTASPASSAVVVDASRGGVCVISLLPADVIIDLFATWS